MTESWLGHRDLCSLQWSDYCDCADGPSVVAPVGSETVQCADRELHGPHGATYSDEDPRDSWWCPGVPSTEDL